MNICKVLCDKHKSKCVNNIDKVISISLFIKEYNNKFI